MFDLVHKNFQELIYKIYNSLFTPKPPNLVGDRDVEYSFISANLPEKPGVAIDFGSGKSNLSLAAALKGYRIIAVDLMPNRFTFQHKNIKFVEGNIFKKPFRNKSIDLIINCSSIEHVGLKGRYGIDRSDNDGDITTMDSLSKFLKKNGVMLLTIPVGKDAVFIPKHRVYGEKRLPLLLLKYKITKEIYWTKDRTNQWIITSKQKALSQKTSPNFYNLGCFVLLKK